MRIGVTHTGGTASLLVDRLPDSLSRDCRIFVQSESTARSKPCGPVRLPHPDSEWIGSHPALPNRLTENAGFGLGTIAGSLRPVGVHSGFRRLRYAPPPLHTTTVPTGQPALWGLSPARPSIELHCGIPLSQHTRQPSKRSPDATGLASRRNPRSDPSMALPGEGGTLPLRKTADHRPRVGGSSF